MRSEIEIRAIQPADAVAVSHLASQSGYDRSPLEICNWIESLHREQNRQAAFVVAVQRHAVGVIEISIEHQLRRPPFAVLGALFIAKGYQNRGFRSLLCARAEDWARARGVKIVRALSNKSNTEAHRFYLQNGFHLTSESVVFEKPHLG
jgi:GNAT superfamily N-acetyltransferase